MVPFYKFPHARGSHLRTSNPIVSPFAALCQRTDAAKRCKNKKASYATAVIWKMLMVAQGRSRRLAAPELLTDVCHGARHINGVRTRELPERAAA